MDVRRSEHAAAQAGPPRADSDISRPDPEVPWAQEVATAGLAWARRRLARLGTPETGAPERVKASAWSLVYRIPTDGGVVWFKASGGDTRYEAGLAQALATWVPEAVLMPLSVEPDRGWQLLPDGGTPLRALAANTDHRAWERFAAGYAELQRRVTPYAAQLLALGVPDHRPAAMPGHFDALLADPAVPIAAPRRAALAASRDRYVEACARLAGAGPAPTVQHDDLHSNNVLPGAASGVDGPLDRRLGSAAPAGSPGDRFFDWGDASVGHPFTSLLVLLRAMAATFEVTADDPAVRRLRDAYLEPWGLGDDGRELAGLAVWTGTVGRALAWRRALVAAGPAELAEFGDAVSGWFEELLEVPVPAGLGHSGAQG